MSENTRLGIIMLGLIILLIILFAMLTIIEEETYIDPCKPKCENNLGTLHYKGYAGNNIFCVMNGIAHNMVVLNNTCYFGDSKWN